MYQIEIYGTNVNMQEVCELLADLMTEDQYLPSGAYAPDHQRVFVRFGAVVEAVRRINRLGYQTDEDELEADLEYNLEDDLQEYNLEDDLQEDDLEDDLEEDVPIAGVDALTMCSS